MKNKSPLFPHFALLKLMLLAFAFFSLQSSHAQYTLLNQTFNPDLIAPRGIGSDAQGNIYVAGWFQTFITLGTFTLDNSASGSSCGFIGKFDPVSGNWIWVKKVTHISVGNAAAHSIIEDMAVDAAGNVYLTGSFRGTIKIDNIQLISTRQGQNYTTDILLFKLSPTGAVVWAKGIGTKSGMDYAMTIELDGSNNIYIGGSFGNESNCYYYGYQKDELYLSKLTNLGVAIWQKRYVSSNAVCQSTNVITNLALDASGAILITGAYHGTVSFGTGSGQTISSFQNTVDPFAAKISNNGTTQWVKAIGGTSSHETASAVSVDAAGNGYFGGSLSPTGYANKYSSSGVLNWSVDPFQFIVNRMVSLGGNSLLAMNSRVGFKTMDTTDGSVTDSDSLVGNIFNQDPYTGNFGIRDFALYGSGYIFMATGRCGTVTIDNLELNCAGTCEEESNYDFFLVQAESLPAYVSQQPDFHLASGSGFIKSNLEFNVHPNPVQDELRIEFTSEISSARFIIHDQFGKEVWSKDATDMNTMSLPLDENLFSSGIYYFTVISNGDVETKRFIVSK